MAAKTLQLLPVFRAIELLGHTGSQVLEVRTDV
jgi:hypothetical protein